MSALGDGMAFERIAWEKRREEERKSWEIDNFMVALEVRFDLGIPR